MPLRMKFIIYCGAITLLIHPSMAARSIKFYFTNGSWSSGGLTSAWCAIFVSNISNLPQTVKITGQHGSMTTTSLSATDTTSTGAQECSVSPSYLTDGATFTAPPACAVRLYFTTVYLSNQQFCKGTIVVSEDRGAVTGSAYLYNATGSQSFLINGGRPF